MEFGDGLSFDETLMETGGRGCRFQLGRAWPGAEVAGGGAGGCGAAPRGVNRGAVAQDGRSGGDSGSARLDQARGGRNWKREKKWIEMPREDKAGEVAKARAQAAMGAGAWRAQHVGEQVLAARHVAMGGGREDKHREKMVQRNLARF